MSKKYSLILFDMDGTFTDSKNFHGLAFPRFFKMIGRDVDLEFIKKSLGITIKDIFNKIGITEDEESVIFRKLSSFYQNDAEDLIREVPIGKNSRYIFEKLYNSGYFLAVVTNSLQTLADQVLKVHNLARYFVKVVGADMQSLDKKNRCLSLLEQLDMPANQALLVGDSENDIALANFIGCDGCFAKTKIGWAKDPQQVIENQHPKYIIDDLINLQEFLL
jgi:Predicted phosphatases